MTGLMSEAIAKPERLSPEQQDELAEMILLEIEEREWDELVASPGSDRFLARLQAEAEQEIRDGTTLPSPVTLRHEGSPRQGVVALATEGFLDSGYDGTRNDRLHGSSLQRKRPHRKTVIPTEVEESLCDS